MELYPVIFHPIIKTMIWGHESWDVSCRPQEMGVVMNGVYAGMDFAAYLALGRDKTMGMRLADVMPFPLLVKIIDARDTLSVQVHPDDAYAAAQNSHDPGKNEMWYILQPPTDGYLIIGLKKEVTRDILRRAFETNGIEACLNRLAVKAGDIVNIPAGLVHALTPGAIVAEIQQNSDTTYRMYDYNRVGTDGQPRELHIAHAQSVTDCDRLIPVETTDAVHNAYFSVEKITLDAPYDVKSDGGAFSIIMCVQGTVAIRHGDGETRLATRASAFIPAGLQHFTFVPESSACILHCSIPE